MSKQINEIDPKISRKIVMMELQRLKNERWPHRVDNDLKAFVVDSVGCKYWVAAYAPEHARAIVMVNEMESCGCDHAIIDDIDKATVSKQSVGDLEQADYYDHDSEPMCKMIDVFEKTRRPGIMACSIW